MFRIAYHIQEVLVRRTAGRIYKNRSNIRTLEKVCLHAVGKLDDFASRNDENVVRPILKARHFALSQPAAPSNNVLSRILLVRTCSLLHQCYTRSNQYRTLNVRF